MTKRVAGYTQAEQTALRYAFSSKHGAMSAPINRAGGAFRRVCDRLALAGLLTPIPPFRLTYEGHMAHVALRRAMWGDSGCMAYLEHFRAAEAALATLEALSEPLDADSLEIGEVAGTADKPAAACLRFDSGVVWFETVADAARASRNEAELHVAFIRCRPRQWIPARLYRLEAARKYAAAHYDEMCGSYFAEGKQTLADTCDATAADIRAGRRDDAAAVQAYLIKGEALDVAALDAEESSNG